MKIIVAYESDFMCMCVNFGEEILLRGGECKSRENLNFTEKGAQKGKLTLQYRLKA